LTIPCQKTKNGREHSIPLEALAASIILSADEAALSSARKPYRFIQRLVREQNSVEHHLQSERRDASRSAKSLPILGRMTHRSAPTFSARATSFLGADAVANLIRYEAAHRHIDVLDVPDDLVLAQ
jgi:hypothetical protein